MMKGGFFRTRFLGVILAAIGFAVLLGNAHHAMAVPQDGPDQDDIGEDSYYGNSFPGDTRHWRFAISNDGYTDIAQTQIKIYLPNPTGTITLRDMGICYNDRGSLGTGKNNYDQVYQMSTGAASTFTIRDNQGNQQATYNGWWNGDSGCYLNTADFNVSGSTKDPNTGMYAYTLTATALDNGKYLNEFFVHGPNGSYITQSSAQGPESIGYQQSQPIPKGSNPTVNDPPDPYKDYSNWTLRMAPDCTVTTPTTQRYVEFYDDDNSGANNDVQPKPFHVRMQEWDRNGNYKRDVYPDKVNWNSTDHNSPTTNSSGGWDDNLVINGHIFHWIYTTGSKRKIRLYYTMNRDMVYQMRIYNVYYDNTLQFKLPFESVYYYVPCQQAGGTLKAGMSSNPPQISPGDSATFTPSITVSDYHNNFTVNCSIERTITAPDGTKSSLGNPPCQTTGGSGDIPVNGNGTITLKPNVYNSPSDVAPGSTICDTITITSPSDSNAFADPGDKTATSCTKVVAHPYLTVLNNDVWAGSRFDYSDNTCSGQSSRNSGITSWVSNGAGAMGEYGVLALGAISGFGSANAPGSTGLTFANIPSNGSLGAPMRCMPNYASQIGTDGGSWPGLSNLPTGKHKYYVNGDLTITGGTVPAGAQAEVVVNGNINVKGNINYADSYTSQSNVSSLWMVSKGNINVQENVTKMSGLFVAEGSSANPGIFQTCVKTNTTVTYSPLTTQVCNQPLDVYGAIMADKIYWQRTRGTASGTQPYAESVHFDPELYLSSPFDSGSTGDVQTQDTKELPPIY